VGRFSQLTKNVSIFCDKIARFLWYTELRLATSVVFVDSRVISKRSALLTLSPVMLLRLYTLPYCSNPPFLIFWHSGTLAHQSARMSEIKYDGLDQYGAGPVEQQQFGTAGVEGVNWSHCNDGTCGRRWN